MEVARTGHVEALAGLLSRHPVVALLGARQVGKTTLSRQLSARVSGPVERFDLEAPADLARLAEPSLALAPLEGLVVLDEVQRLPGLFPVLRVLVDRPGAKSRFLLLGSASPDLVRGCSETLAGRIAFHDLGGFTLDELPAEEPRRLWLRGGFPRSFLAESDGASAEWRRFFVRTFLERDLPGLGVATPPTTMRRLWTMLAHGHGQLWNGAHLAAGLSVSASTVRRHLGVLAGAFVVTLLPPFHANVRKRQVKAPKVYLADSGMLHSLLGLETARELESHPAVGASWEGFAIAQVVHRLGARPEERFFWATHGGAELDLLVVRGGRRLGFEMKRTDAPRTSRSMHVALEDLELERLDVVHAGERAFPLGDRIRALPLSGLLDHLEPLE